MFRIIGSDQRMYGPVGADIIRQWIAEGRVNASTLIQVEGSAEWKPVSAYPEFLPGGVPPVSPGFQGAVPPQPQPQPRYQPQPQPLAVYPVAPTEGNSTATLGFIFGVLSIVCCCGSYLFGVAGLVLSIVGLNRASRMPNGEGKSLAVAGLILSVIGLAGGLLLPFLSLVTHPHGGWTFRW